MKLDNYKPFKFTTKCVPRIGIIVPIKSYFDIITEQESFIYLSNRKNSRTAMLLV